MTPWKCLFKDAGGSFVDFLVLVDVDGVEAKQIFLNAYLGRDLGHRHGAEVWRSGNRVAVFE